MEKIIHSLFKITQDVTGFVLKTEFFFLGFNFLKANSHHENIKKRKVVVACKKSFKVELQSPCWPLVWGGGGKGGATFFGGRGNKVNYGKCANNEQGLILARPLICVFTSFFLRFIGIKYVWFDIYLFQYFKNLKLVEKIVFHILKKRYPKPFWKDDKAYDCQ